MILVNFQTLIEVEGPAAMPSWGAILVRLEMTMNQWLKTPTRQANKQRKKGKQRTLTLEIRATSEQTA